MHEPLTPQPQQGSWTDLILPFAIGAGSLASGFASGRNPNVANPGATFLQPLQTMSLLDYRNSLGQHYKDLTAYQQADEARKLAVEQRAIEQFNYDKADKERQRRIAEANEARKVTGFNQSQALLRQFGIGGGQLQGTPQQGAPASTPPAGLPNVRGLEPGMFQAPQTQLPTGEVGGMQYKPRFNFTDEGVNVSMEEPPESVNRRLAQTLAPQFGVKPEQVFAVLSGATGKFPTDLEKQSQVVQGSLSLLSKYDQQSTTYLNMRDAFHRMREVAANPNPLEPAAGDMSLMYSYVRLLDPNTGVKEGEYATIQNAPGLPERWRNLYNRVVQGGKLPPEFKAEMLNKSEQMYMAALKNQARLEAQYKQQLGQMSAFYGMGQPPVLPADFIREDRS